MSSENGEDDAVPPSVLLVTAAPALIPVPRNLFLQANEENTVAMSVCQLLYNGVPNPAFYPLPFDVRVGERIIPVLFWYEKQWGRMLQRNSYASVLLQRLTLGKSPFVTVLGDVILTSYNRQLVPNIGPNHATPFYPLWVHPAGQPDPVPQLFTEAAVPEAFTPEDAQSVLYLLNVAVGGSTPN